MKTHFITQPAIVYEVTGNAVVVDGINDSRGLSVGDDLQVGNAVIISTESTVLININGNIVNIIDDCISCSVKPYEQSPESNADLQVVNESKPLQEPRDDLSDIAQAIDAIFNGADPTQVLEATAAGEIIIGSANAGFVTLRFDQPEVDISTFFETMGTQQPSVRDDEERLNTIIFANGGENSVSALTEGSLSSNTYPQTTTSRILVDAGSLDLLSSSFVPEPILLQQLLNELNNDITSSDLPVNFSYDTASNSIIGQQGINTVLTISIDAISIGSDVEVIIITTIERGIDHLPSIGSGLVTIDNDVISINIDITGNDSANNSITSPIKAVIQINDGATPEGKEVSIVNIESESNAIQGNLVILGSDEVKITAFLPSVLEQFDGVVSNGSNVIATLSNNNQTLNITTENGDKVFTISLNDQGDFEFEQLAPLEQGVDNESKFLLPIQVADFDNDVTQALLNVSVLDGAPPEIISIEPLNINENVIVSDENNRTISGLIITNEGSDAVVRYELGIDEFNLEESFLSNGKSISLELISNDNSYRGFITDANGDKQTVFEIDFDNNILGAYQFTLLASTDDLNNDDLLKLELPVYAIDSDGDRSTFQSNDVSPAMIVINIIDDKPTIDDISAGSQQTVDEDDIASIGSDGAQSAIINGRFDVTDGADGIVRYDIANLTAPVQGLTSNGQAIELIETSAPNATLTQYSAQIIGTTEVVFTVTLDSSDDSYQFTLLGALDHAVANGQNTLVIDFPITATDFDNDTTPLAFSLPISVVDDVLNIIDVTDLVVSEVNLTDGSAPNNAALTQTGMIDVKGSDSAVSYQLDLAANISGITSNGSPVSITLDSGIDSDPLVYLALNIQGEPVFSLSVSQQGDYELTLLGEIDHPENQDSVNITLPMLVTDFDGDITETRISLTINDDKPSIDDIRAGSQQQVDEDDIVSIGSDGSQSTTINGRFDVSDGADGIVRYDIANLIAPVQGLTSNGQAIELIETSAPNATLTQYSAQIIGTTEVVFTITLDSADDSYQFTLLGALDHAAGNGQNTLVIDFPITATDFDNDTTLVAFSLPISVVDDVLNIIDVTDLVVSEVNLTDGSTPNNAALTQTGVIDVKGSDSTVSYQLDLAANISGITSHGLAVSITLDSAIDSDPLVYLASNTQGDPVFSLSVSQQGEYELTLLGEIDHPENQDSVNIAIPLLVTDFDGDVTETSISLTINDDKPTIDDISAGSQQQVDEDDIVSIGSDGSQSTTINGRFDVSDGADGIVRYDIANLIAPVQGLTSNGQAIELIETSAPNATLTQYSAQIIGTTELVFTITLDSADDSYQFTLLGALDHALANGQNTLVIDFPITATDFDNDTTPVAFSLPISVVDDVLNIIDVTELAVSEVNLADGSAPNNAALTQTGMIDVKGSDSAVSYQLDLATNISGITSNGSPVTVVLDSAIDSNPLVYLASNIQGEPVFSLSVSQQGEYELTLLGEIDHPENQDSVNIALPLLVTDFDGDVTETSISLTINDDKPTIDDIRAGSQQQVDEDDITLIGSDGSQSTTINGNFDVTDGADGIVRYDIANLTAPVQGLTSNGQAIELIETSEPNATLTQYSAQIIGTAEVVFTVTLDSSDDSYQFTLLGALDHAVANGQNTLVIDFPITATDFDNDTTPVAFNLPISVVDDVLNIIDVTNLVVSEVNLTDGSAPNSVALTQTGVIDVKGSDSAVSYKLDLATNISGITAHGLAVSITLDSAIDSDPLVYLASNTQGEPVFSLSVSQQGDYELTLLGEIDHPENQDSVNIALPMLVTDFDGDVTETSISLTINDDKPTIDDISAGSQQQVDEDDIVSIGSDGSQSTTINGNFDVTDGADGIVRYDIASLTAPVQGLTSNGQAIELIETSAPNATLTQYTAQIIGTTESVFTLSLNSTDDSYQFTLLGALDHAIANGQNTLVIDFPITATDFDNDTTPVAFSLPISVVDDVLNIIDVTDLAVSEVNLTDGSTPNNAALTQTGMIDVKGSDSAVSYQLDLSANISGITSNGSPLNITLNSAIDSDPLMYLASNTQGETVFSLSVSQQGDYELTLLGEIDHPENQDSVNITLPMLVTDFDGDVTETRISLTINDDKPSVDDISAGSQQQVDEDDIASIGSDGSQSAIINGNFDVTDGADGIVRYDIANLIAAVQGLTSNGQAIELIETSAPNATLTQYSAQIIGTTELVFTVTLDSADDSYQFTLLGALDHALANGQNTLVIDFPITATDFDNDTTPVAFSLPISVVDDVLNIIDVTELAVSEVNLADGSAPNNAALTQTGMIDVKGSDSAVSYQLDLATNISGITSNGSPVTVVLDSAIDSDPLVYLASNTQGEPVFSLSVSQQGEYELILLGEIDHLENQDSVNIALPMLVTDFDGDVTETSISLTINDDKPTIDDISAGSQQQVDEDDIDSIGSDGSQSAIINGNFDVTDGADGIVRYDIANLIAPVQGLTSNGQAIELIETSAPNATLTQYTAQIIGTTEVVFTITLDSSDDSYQFTLLGALDHAVANGQNTLVIDFPITATDFDNDTTPVAFNLPISVVDDVLNIIDVTDLVVSEVNLTDGSAPNSVALTQTGVIDVKGSDSAVSYQLDLAVNISGITSNGSPVTVALSSTNNSDPLVYLASNTQGDPVFSLSVSQQGGYELTLLGEIDHPENQDSVNITLPMLVTDFDGDVTETSISLTINDDKSTIDDISAGSQQQVDEDDIASIGSDGSQSSTINGNFDVTDGADGIVRYDIVSLTAAVQGLTSNGQAIELIETSAPNATLTQYSAQIIGTTELVFTITLDSADDSYQFTLLGALDHAAGNGQNTLVIDFLITATDFDNDTTPVAFSLPISVVDDVLNIIDVTDIAVSEVNLIHGSAPNNAALTQTGMIDVKGSDSAVSYQLDLATNISGITSNGSPVTVVLDSAIDSDPLVYLASNTQGDPVFSLSVSQQGDYELTLLGEIDHPENQDSVNIAIPLLVTDFDGDVTETRISLTINDDKPSIDDISAGSQQQVDEDDIVSIGSDGAQSTTINGNFDVTDGADGIVRYDIVNLTAPVQGLTSNGQAIELIETSSPNATLTQYSAQIIGTTELVFTVTLDSADDSYQFTLLGALDHGLANGQNTLVIDFPITATDFDNDTTPLAFSLPISVVDDVLNIIDVTDLVVSEVNLTDGSAPNSAALTQTGMIDVKGSDSAVSYQLDLATNISGITSHGLAVSIILESAIDSDPLVYFASNTQGDPVFSLSVSQQGGYELTLLGEIDHPENQDSVNLSLPMLVTDFDGDVTETSISLTINDDKPTIDDISAGSQQQVDEDDIVSIGSDGSQSTTINGNFDVTDGADGIVRYDVANLITPVQGLTSNGQAIELIETSAPNTALAQYSAQIIGTTEVVFTITLDSSDDSYQFTLLGALDHAVANGQNTLVIDFPITATDFDNDTTPVAFNLPISVVDDVLNIIDVTNLVVSEVNLTDGSAPNSVALTQTGVIDVKGSDSAVSYKLDLATNISGITAHGLAVSITLDSAIDSDPLVYLASNTQGDPVFSLSVSQLGDYELTLLGEIDHPENQDSVNIALPMLVTDFDGDVTETRISLTINDDKPTIDDISAGSQQQVDEDDIASIGSDGSQSSTINGNFDATDGADGIVRYDIANLTAPVQGLTSNGQAIELIETSAPNTTLTQYTAQIIGTTESVFTLSLNSTDDSYQFTLLGALDHAIANGQNTLVIDFPITATDFDNDTTPLAFSLPISVVDDVATILSLESNSQTDVDEKDTPMGSDQTGSRTLVGSFDVEAGSDGVSHLVIANSDNVLDGLQSNERDLELQLISNLNGVTQYQAVVLGTTDVIFTIDFNAVEQSYLFELLGALDHSDVQGRNNLDIPFQVAAVDNDGDQSADQALTINITDDVPRIIDVEALSVDEDDLANGSDTDKELLIDEGQFTTITGADGIASYQIDLTQNILQNVTSDGQVLTLNQVSQIDDNFTYRATKPDGTPVFTLLLNSNGSYRFTLENDVDHSQLGEDILTINLPVFATDVDGDRSNIILPIDIVDDIPQIYDSSISRVEGQGNRTVQLFTDPLEGDQNQGADGSVITSFNTQQDGVYFVLNNTIVQQVELNGRNRGVNVFKELDGVETNIGRLVARQDGRISFNPNDDLNHQESDVIELDINFIATDGDNDTSEATLSLSISDRNAQIQTSIIQTFEDSGRNGVIADQEQANVEDNLSGLITTPSLVQLSVNLHDTDRDEKIGTVSIGNINRHNGTFYFKDSNDDYLEVSRIGNNLVLDADQVQQTITGEVATLTNLYFVPDRNYATDDDGFTVRLSVGILNNTTLDHSINGRLTIEVDSVADIATWTTQSQFYYAVNEDKDNVTLSLAAQIQDQSNTEELMYELVITEGANNAQLIYQDGTPLIANNNNMYLVESSRINEVQIDPANDFSGQINILITAITTEIDNPLTNKETARSETEQIIIDVNPISDQSGLQVNRISIFEDNAATQNTIDPITDNDPLLLSEVIQMTYSVDDDGSESLFVRINEFMAGNQAHNVEVKWLGNASDNPIETVLNSDGSIAYFEIPETSLDNVALVSPLNSNADFTFQVEGIVKDTALLSSGISTNIASIDTRIINVGVKGVADTPILNLEQTSNFWQLFSDGNTQGIQASINENGEVPIDFSIVSGETADSPNDNSETITVLLSNIPENTQITDTDGASVDFTFAGFDQNGNPTYEANITEQNINSGLIIKPDPSSTENIVIDTTIFISENDGHIRQISGEIRVQVLPVIEVKEDYKRNSNGNEDTAIAINWAPNAQQKTDDDEFYAEVVISGFPPNSQVTLDGVIVSIPVNGELILTPQNGETEQAFSNRILESGYVRVQPELNSSLDFTLTTKLVVKEIDADDIDGEVSKVINGSVNVTVNPIVESTDVSAVDPSLQTKLLISDQDGLQLEVLSANDSGQINFTINDNSMGSADANVIKYQEFDASSTERVTELIVQFNETDPAIFNQLIIIGAINEGNGRWVVSDEENFSITAPNGLDFTPEDNTDDDINARNQLSATIFAQVYDVGEDGIEQVSEVPRSTDIVLEFPEVLDSNTSVAATISYDGLGIITGQEDTEINLGAQLTQILTLMGDTVADRFTVVIDVSSSGGQVPSGISIVSSDFDFINGKYVFEGEIDENGVVSANSTLLLIPPPDYSGDFILPIEFITTDNLSGDTKDVLYMVPVQVSPLVDIETTPATQPEDVTLIPTFDVDITGTLGLDANKQPVDDFSQAIPTNDGIGYEDGIIQLSFTNTFADKLNTIEGGRERISDITLTLADPSIGQFVDSNGEPLLPNSGSVNFTQSQIDAGALDEVLFAPFENFPSNNKTDLVIINLTGKITDTATFNNDVNNITTEIQDGNFSSSVSFSVTPVVDDVSISVGQSDEPIILTGDEDTLIPLSVAGEGVIVALNDLDGSEQILSIRINDVPDNFVITSAQNSDLRVNNVGDGEWLIQTNNTNVTELDLSNLFISPAQNFSGELDLALSVFVQEEILAVPTEFTQTIKVNINPIADVIDVTPDTALVGAEGVDIEININAKVFDDSQVLTPSNTYQENQAETIRLTVSNVPEGASLRLENGTPLMQESVGTYSVIVDAQQLDKVIFNSGDVNLNSWTDPLSFSLSSVETDLSGIQTFGTAEQFIVDIEVNAVNDRPIVIINDVTTAEDNSIALIDFSIKDVDANLDDSSAEYRITLNVDSGIVNLNTSILDTLDVRYSGNSSAVIELVGTLGSLNDAIVQSSLLFVPNSNFNGDVNVMVEVDDQGNSGVIIDTDPNTQSTNFGEFVINVTEVNDAPQTTPVLLNSIDEDTSAFFISSVDLLANSSDIEFDDLTVSNLLLIDPNVGSLMMIAPQQWSFVPAENYFGPVSFSYDITDNGTTNGVSAPLTISNSASFDVIAVNDAPELDTTSVTATILEATDQKISGIIVNDVDFSGAQENEVMTVSLSLDNGSLSVVLPNNSTITQGTGVLGELVLMGSLADINALLSDNEPTQGLFVDAANVAINSLSLTIKAEDNGVYYQGNGQELSVEQSININVTPVADAPLLSIDPEMQYIKNISASQSVASQGIALIGIVAALSDVRETLTLQISNVPSSAAITSNITPSGIVFDGTNWLIPENEISSAIIEGADIGTYTLSLTAISTESNNDTAQSDSIDINLAILADQQALDQSSNTEDGYLLGGNSNQVLLAGEGNDRLEGNDGNDQLDGGAGNDTIDGGLGFDILTGGAGEDIFKWTVEGVDDGVLDIITDFTVNEDTIDLGDVISELKDTADDMDTLLANIGSKIEASYDENFDFVTLDITTDDNVTQTILVENLGTQLNLASSMDSQVILSSLLLNNVINNEL